MRETWSYCKVLWVMFIAQRAGVANIMWGGSWTVRELPLSFLCLTKFYSPLTEERERKTKKRKSKRERDRDECS